MEDEFGDDIRRDYLLRHLNKLLYIRNRVQILPLDSFTHRDLRWCKVAADKIVATARPSDREPTLDSEEPAKVKHIAYIPWKIVMNFKDGKERGKKDVETVLRHTKKNTKNKDDMKKVKWNVLIDSWM